MIRLIITAIFLMTVSLSSIAAQGGTGSPADGERSSDEGTGVKGNGDGGGECIIAGTFEDKDGNVFVILTGKDGKGYVVAESEAGSFSC